MNPFSRRQFVKTTATAGAGTFLLSNNLVAAIKKEALIPSLQGKKVLYIWGGWPGHEPEQSVGTFVPWLKSEGADVTVSNSLDSYLDEELMGSLDLIIQIMTMSTITKEQEKSLLKAVKSGTGLAGWHGGIGDAFRNNPDFQFMVGVPYSNLAMILPTCIFL